MNPPSPQPPAAPQGPQTPYSEHTPEENARLQTVHNPLAVMQQGEKVLCEIKRHPIGLIGIYASAGLLLTLLAVGIFIFGPMIFPNNTTGQIYQTGGLAFIIAAAFTLLFVWAASIVYNGNRWIVTDDSITQVTQTGLFAKQSSQLSMANLEDITAEQNGILPHLFGYGVLKAETAGEHAKFHFYWCPRPNYFAQCVLEARENFEQNNYRTAESQARPLTSQFMPNPNQSNYQQPPQNN